jgi:acyl carrier protein
VARVWSRALALERIDATRNFFDLGGNSLLLARVHAELQDELAPTLSIVDLFRHPTVRDLAAHLDAGEAPSSALAKGLDRGARRRAAREARRRA